VPDEFSAPTRVFGFFGVFPPPGVAGPNVGELAFFTALADQAAVVVTQVPEAAPYHRIRWPVRGSTRLDGTPKKRLLVVVESVAHDRAGPSVMRDQAVVLHATNDDPVRDADCLGELFNVLERRQRGQLSR